MLQSVRTHVLTAVPTIDWMLLLLAAAPAAAPAAADIVVAPAALSFLFCCDCKHI